MFPIERKYGLNNQMCLIESISTDISALRFMRSANSDRESKLDVNLFVRPGVLSFLGLADAWSLVCFGNGELIFVVN